MTSLGYGSGSGDGYGHGLDYGCRVGSGFGSGDGDGYGSGSDYGGANGEGYGFGYGFGSGYGDGYGDGYPSGDGFGYGDGYSYGSDVGYGSGAGYGDDVLVATLGEYEYEVRAIITPWGRTVRVGCQVHSLDIWRERWREIAREHDVTVSAEEVAQLIALIEEAPLGVEWLPSGEGGEHD